MCRVAVRKARHEDVSSSQILEQLQQNISVPEDISNIFDNEANIDTDLDFLDLFDNDNNNEESAEEADAVLGNLNQDQGPNVTSSSDAVQAQAVTYPAQTMFPTQAQLQQQYAQILQQQMLAQFQSNALPPIMNKRGKTAFEIAEQQERIKKRRRESAQRSRQRKSAYMKSLECENHALKVEIERLRKELNRVGSSANIITNNNTKPEIRRLPNNTIYQGDSTTSGSSPGVKTETPSYDIGALLDNSSAPTTAAGSCDLGGLCPIDASGYANLGENAVGEGFVAMVL